MAVNGVAVNDNSGGARSFDHGFFGWDRRKRKYLQTLVFWSISFYVLMLKVVFVDTPKNLKFSGFVAHWVLDDVTLVCLCYTSTQEYLEWGVCMWIPFSYFYFRRTPTIGFVLGMICHLDV